MFILLLYFCIGIKITLLFRKNINSFMNSHGNYGHNSDKSQKINHKLATLLALIVSFQQKIEVLRTKISGNPNFSPQLYYKQLDRTQKGYISNQDLVAFIKKSKPQFNIDIRYLNQMIVKLNKDSKVPKDRLTYFGYLNIIKPYFDTNLAKDLLLRDNMGAAKDANTLCLVVKKILEDLICTMYVCVAEHQRIKENIIMGDIEYGGTDPGHLFNIYEILQIIQQNSTSRQQITSMQQLVQPQTHPNQPSSRTQSPHHRPPATSTAILSKKFLQSSGLAISNTRQGTLDMFYNFIMKNSQFQIQRGDMKYLLAYLMCHEFMLTNERYLTTLFMPVAASVEISHLPHSAYRNQHMNNYNQQVSGGSQQINFLGYVHPNSLKQQDMKTLMKNRDITNNERIARPRANTNKIHKPPVQQQQQLIDQQPRILIHAPQNNLHTPILQKFMRESKILKNMSRHRMDKITEQQDSNQSAFIQQSRHKNSPLLRPQQHENVEIEIGKQHEQKPINKDFNLQQVLNNSNLQRSQYYHNLSMRAYIKDQPLQPEEISSRSHLRGLDGSGILNNFMLK